MRLYSRFNNIVYNIYTMSIFVLIALCFIAGNIYIYIRALQTLSFFPISIKIIFTVLYWMSAISLFLAMSLRNSDIPSSLSKIIFIIGSTWLAFTLYMTLCLFATDIIKIFTPCLRHGFIYALTVTILILVTGHINYLYPRINKTDIFLDKPITGDTVTIVAVSDLHLGYETGRNRLRTFVDLINSQNPDIVLIGGDLIDNNTAPLYKENMAEELRRIKSTLGIYMAPGNHEYISGIEESKRFIQQTPIRMMADSMITLPNGIQIICRDDKANRRRRMPLDKLIAKADKEKPIILVDHQPFDIAYKDSLGVDIQFSGHTHRGQIWPGNIITDMLFEQSHGYRKWSHSHVYVSSGISLWGPKFRIGSNSDIGVFKIISTTKK